MADAMPAETVPDPSVTRIAEYFSAIRPWAPCYRRQTFSYFGIREGKRIYIYKARIRLEGLGKSDQWDFASGPFVGGRIPIRRLGLSAEELLSRFAVGQAVTGRNGYEFVLPTDMTGGIYVEPPTLLHPEGVQSGHRLSVLTVLAGAPASDILNPAADWVLKAGESPFDGVSDALLWLGLGGQLTNRCSVDVVATSPIEVLAESRVRGAAAELGVWVLPGLRRSGVRLTYRVFDKGNCIDRGSIAGRSMTWSKNGPVNIGRATIKVPQAAIVNLSAVYADHAHHVQWAGDPENFQNPRLAALDTVDKGQQLLKAYLLPNEIKGAAQLQFESAVAWVLWALGLSVVQTDRADQAKEGPDVIAVAPNGGQLLVECTVGLLKTESKLAKIARRAVDVQERLKSVGATATPVVPVIVTALPRDKVAAELDAATESGVLVVTREDLEVALTRMLLFPDGDQYFRAAQEALASTAEVLRRKKDAIVANGSASVANPLSIT